MTTRIGKPDSSMSMRCRSKTVAQPAIQLKILDTCLKSHLDSEQSLLDGFVVDDFIGHDSFALDVCCSSVISRRFAGLALPVGLQGPWNLL